MPNWCDNRLKIAGDSKEIARFIKAVSKLDDDGDTCYSILNSLLPTPVELEETPALFGTRDEERMAEHNKLVERNKEKYGFADWYNWRLHHWGTKWNDSDTYLPNEFEEGDTATEFRFQTAWSPCVEGIVRISEQFPALVFVLSFAEMGFGFVGAIGAWDGEMTAEHELDFPDPSKFEGEDIDEDQSYVDWYNAVFDLMEQAENLVISDFHISYQRLFDGIRPFDQLSPVE